MSDDARDAPGPRPRAPLAIHERPSRSRAGWMVCVTQLASATDDVDLRDKVRRHDSIFFLCCDINLFFFCNYL